jgi:hypothetical protein
MFEVAGERYLFIWTLRGWMMPVAVWTDWRNPNSNGLRCVFNLKRHILNADKMDDFGGPIPPPDFWPQDASTVRGMFVTGDPIEEWPQQVKMPKGFRRNYPVPKDQLSTTFHECHEFHVMCDQGGLLFNHDEPFRE